jgi:glycosyltransferase involved in cell wall biosynthesis
LLRAFRLAAEDEPRLVLLLVGEGELRGELEALARELGLGSDRVRFLGFRNDVGRILGALDLFVMSSSQEGLGTSVADAMMAGVPVAATRAGGLPEIVVDGRTGRLVPPADPEGMARAILEAVANRGETARVAAEAQRRARERFSADAMVEATLRAYRDMLDAAGLRAAGGGRG